MRIKTKIILLFSGSVACIILCFACYISYFTWDSLKTKFFHRLEENVKIVGNHTIERDEYNSKLYYKVRRKYLRQLSEGNDYLLRIVKGSKTLRFKPDLPMPMSFYQEAITKGKAEYLHRDTAYFAMFFLDTLHKEDLLVISSGRDTYGHAEQRDLHRTLISGSIIVLLLIVLTAFYFAEHILTPIIRIINRIRGIDISNLDARLEYNNNSAKDEIASLVHTFNDMLDRLEIAVKSQQNFVGNASHSLRTPLTVIGGEAEIALSHLDQEHKAYFPVQNVASEAEKMRLIVKNLLLMARTGYQQKVQHISSVRMDELILEIKDSIYPLYPDVKIYIDYTQLPEDSDLLNIRANKDLLHIAISNVVQNACKYGKANQVSLAVFFTSDHQLAISVKDEGIGIPEADQPHIFESFFRAANTTGIYGNGLGLPLTKNILSLHNASIEIHSKENIGTTVTMIFRNT
jgi:signal transduction histidine kinase